MRLSEARSSLDLRSERRGDGASALEVGEVALGAHDVSLELGGLLEGLSAGLGARE